MNQTRLKKFKKLFEFQQKKCDLAKQKLAAQQKLIAGLNQQRAELQQQMGTIEQQFNTQSGAAMLNQHCDLSMIHLQKKINAKQSEITTAVERLADLLHEFREQDKQLKSWEQLIARETNQLDAALLRLDMKEADERYLATRFSGDQS